MQLHKIKQYLQEYANYLDTPDAYKRLHYWESQRIWQENWDKDATDWHTMFDNCLQNSTTKRLWKREAYEPKRMMKAFIEMDKHFVFSMFDDLFNEDQEVHSRVDRFVFYCDQLMMQFRKNKPLNIDTGHYHDDGYQIISLYLSFQFPDLYAPYHAEQFITLLQKIGAANIPLAGDFSRHVKVMRTLQKFINKEEELLSRHAARLQANHYQEESLLLAFDFVQFVVNDSLMA